MQSRDANRLKEVSTRRRVLDPFLNFAPKELVCWSSFNKICRALIEVYANSANLSMTEVEKFCEEFFQWRLTEYPEFATFCGEHKHDDRLNDHSVAAFQRREVDARGFLEKCESLSKLDGLSKADKLNLRLLSEDLTLFLQGLACEGYLFPINFMEGMYADFELVTSWMKFDSLADYQMYIKRLQALPARLRSDIELMKTGISKGKTLNKVSVIDVPGIIGGILAQEPESTCFCGPFTKTPECLELAAVDPLKMEALTIIRGDILPTLQALKTFLEQVYIPACRTGLGITSVPDGLTFYNQCLWFHTSQKISHQEVHDLGLKEVARIRKEMEKGDFKDFLAELRENKDFFFETKEDLLREFQNCCRNKIRPTLPKLFPKIPESDLIIEASPPERQNSPMAYYLAGTLDGSRPGKIYVNCHDLETCPKRDIIALALHEGEPGHHFQGMYAIESTGLPSFRRYMEDMNYLQIPSHFSIATAYCEGWGLYCEYLGNELGLYTDPYSLFGHLSLEMHRACRLVADTGLHVLGFGRYSMEMERACRLVADTGLHCLGWSFEQAVDLFLTNTALAEVAVRNEVKRYCTWPAQACAYKIGELKLKKLRQEANAQLGEKFDVKEFHDEVLAAGMVPLNVLETLIEDMVKRKLHSD